jgi:hypothetical protein
VTQEVVRLSLGPPSDTLGPIGNSSSVTSLVHGSRVVLLDLLRGESGRLTRLGELVVRHRCADGVGGREVGVFTGDTEVVTGGTVTDISLLGSGVDESVKVSEVFNADMGPDVGSWLLVRSTLYNKWLTLAKDTSLSSVESGSDQHGHLIRVRVGDIFVV